MRVASYWLTISGSAARSMDAGTHTNVFGRGPEADGTGPRKPLRPERRAMMREYVESSTR